MGMPDLTPAFNLLFFLVGAAAIAIPLLFISVFIQLPWWALLLPPVAGYACMKFLTRNG